MNLMMLSLISNVAVRESLGYLPHTSPMSIACLVAEVSTSIPKYQNIAMVMLLTIYSI